MNPDRPGAAPRPWRALLTRTLAAACAAGIPAFAVAQECAPVAIPASLLTTTTPWAQVAAYLPDSAFSVPGNTRDISPCYMGRTTTPCAKMTAQIRPQTRSYCFTPGMLGDSTQAYVLGTVRYLAGHQWAQLGFGSQNADQVIYLAVLKGKGLTIYQDVHRTVGLKGGEHGGGWDFLMNNDGPYHDARAEWKPNSLNPHGTAMTTFRRSAAVRSGPADLLPDDSDAQDDGVYYGWMTCAPGCCQFHGTSGGVGEPGPEDHGHQGPEGPPPPGHHPHMQVTKDTPRPGRE